MVWTLNPRFQSGASLAAAILALVSALALYALSYFEHSRCVRPSLVINAYLLVTVLLDAAKVRTLWLRAHSPSASVVATSVLLVKLIVLIIEAREKQNILKSPYSSFSPEVTSGLYTRSIFWWLNPIFLTGYRRIIQNSDLFPMDEALTSEVLHRRFQDRWSRRQILHRFLLVY